MQGLAGMQALEFCGVSSCRKENHASLAVFFLADEKISVFRKIIPNQYGTS
jgi:hypothetical protein